MTGFILTRHATTRIAQRGVSLSDIELICLIGTEVEGGYFVRDQDFQEIEKVLKNLLHRLERIVGKRAVIDAGQVVTVYHTSNAHQRRLLRHADEPDLG
jgi:uncharacterized protein YccT (UPF0319 family)